MSTNEQGDRSPFNLLLEKITTIEYLVICLVQSHPDKAALHKQLSSLYEFLEEPHVARGASIARTIQDLTGFAPGDERDAR